MKKLFSLLLVVLLLCSLCGVSAAADNAEDIVGTYTLVSAYNEENGDLSESLQLMATLGMTATLTVNPDGSAVFDLFGEQQDLHFDFAAGTVSSDDGEDLPYRLEDGKLYLGDETNYFVFSEEGLEPADTSFQGPFRYFLVTTVQDAKGNDVLDEYDISEDELGSVGLFLFEDGSARFEDLDRTLDMYFDFENMTVDAGDGDILPFSLEGTTLVLENTYGDYMVLEQTDPGFVGPYEMTFMVTESQGDLSEQISVLKAVGMTPTLTLEEDGSGVLVIVEDRMNLQFDFDAMTVEVDGESLPFTYEFGVIQVGEGSNAMHFARILPEPEEP